MASAVDFKYKRDKKLNQRKKECEGVLAQYPDRTPVICQVSPNCDFKLDKYKYLVPSSNTFGHFFQTIRAGVKLSPEKSLIFMVNNTMITPQLLMSQVYKEHKDEDGFLYIYIMEESTFG